jgi:hypothetical protein
MRLDMVMGDRDEGDPQRFLQVDQLEYRQVREQGVGLEHQVHRPAIRRELGHVGAVDEDPATSLSRVVLPHPEPPSSEKNSPW